MEDFILKVTKKRINALIPKRATLGSAGFDLFACLEENICIKPKESILIPTGIAIELPNRNMAAFIFARSGLSTKFGISLSNGVGVIDSDYRGEIFVGLRNFSTKEYIIEKNERIAQMIIMPVYCLPILEVDKISKTERGECGFGSTGKTNINY